MAKDAGISRIQRLLNFIASATALVVLMGLPATVLQYVDLNIPIGLLSYRRVLEAGAIPALILGLFVTYFMWVARRAERDKESLIIISAELRTRRARGRLMEGLYPGIPLIYSGFLIGATGMIAIVIWVVWTLGWIVVKPSEWLILNSRVSDAHTTLIGFITLSVIFVCALAIRWSKVDDSTNLNATSSAEPVYEEPSTSSYTERARGRQLRPPRHANIITWLLAPRTLREALNRSFRSYVLFPVVLIGTLYLVRSAASLVALNWPVGLDHEIIITTGLAIGIAYAHGVGTMTISTFVYSSISDVRDGARIALATTHGTFIVACVVAYSVFVFPVLPRSLGGGRPDIINITVKSSAIPPSLTTRLQANDVSVVEIPGTRLIDRNSSDTIFCENDEMYSCFALPTGSIVGFSWHSAANR